jgi:hypothetical protein
MALLMRARIAAQLRLALVPSGVTMPIAVITIAIDSLLTAQ